MKLPILGIMASAGLLAASARPAAAQQLEQPIKYTVDLKAPPNSGNATGRATMRFEGHKITYEVSVHDLSGPATMAHIHVGRQGTNGPPVYTFAITSTASGTLAKGTIDLSTDVSKGVSGDSLRVLLNNGNAYINVHTAAHPSGEIRGQIVRQ